MRFYNYLPLMALLNITVSLAAALIFYLSFQNNFFFAANEKWFESHQFDSEALIIGRMTLTRNEGLWSEAGRLGRFHQIQGDTDKNQKKLFEGELSEQGKYYPYNSQIGGQGLFYSMLHQLLLKKEIPLDKHIEKLHQISSFLLALVLAILILCICIEFGIITALITTISLAYAQWLVVFADNLYWFTWSMYAPMVGMFSYLLFTSRNKIYPKARYISLALFFLIFIRCSAGYEYVSTILIAMMTPAAYYACKDKWETPFTIRFFIITGSVSIIAFITVNILHIHQISIAEIKPFLESLSERFSHAHSRTHIDAEAFGGGAWREGTTASVWDVLYKYWSGESYNFSNFSNLKFHINFYDIIYLLIGLTLASQIPLSEKSQKILNASPNRDRKYQSLRYVCWLAILAPVSWYVLAKVHSYVHGHMNHLLWHIPMTIWIAIFTGVMLQERMHIYIGILRENSYVRYITLLVTTYAVLSFLVGPHISYNKTLKNLEKDTVYSFDMSENGKLLLLDKNKLVILREDCKELDKTKRFFLHVYIENKQSFENLDFNWSEKSIQPLLRKSCIAIVNLPMKKINKIRIGQFDGPRLWENLYHLKQLDEASFTAKDLTDKNWKNGISIRGEASLFTSNSLALRQTLKPGGYLTLANSGVRKIKRVEHTPDYINIWLNGPELSPELDGFPNAINYHLEEKNSD